MDLAALVAPGRCAVVTQECQNGILGEHAVFPEMAAAARANGVVAAIARLVVDARAVGIPVVHCVALRRPDGLGASTNARLFAIAASAAVTLEPGSHAAAIVDEIGVGERDLISERYHGVGPMWGTDLDALLRNLGVSTVIAVGVSVNIGLTDLVISAVNAGYQVVLPRDAVAGVPTEYADAVIEHTLSLLATVTTVDEIVAAWT